MTEKWIQLQETEVKNTIRLKKIIIVGRLIKYGIFIIFVWSLAEVLKILSPYVNDPEMVLDNAFTNSQLTAIVVLLFLVWVLIHLGKIFSKKWFNLI